MFSQVQDRAEDSPLTLNDCKKSDSSSMSLQTARNRTWSYKYLWTLFRY